METPPAAFQNDNPSKQDGEYDPAYLASMKAHHKSLGCVASVVTTRAQVEHQALTAAGLFSHIYASISLAGIEDLGHAKIGGGVGSFGDCQHYCMPGVPDQLARTIHTLVVAVSKMTST